ncbi:glutaminase A [Caldalkalibacillus salinus]|uniref:glutaminase A n=1 Tax=Caldalkalibacillus salinus TaxID=2803787 RepID=UPI0019234017|nr:glutaminase A [Caldalkalibacillus salinus]
MVEEHQMLCCEGEVADYIPELGKVDPSLLGVSVCTLDGEVVEAGDTSRPFTMQSISKVLALALALMDRGEDVVFDVVGMEPTGDPFNSIIKLETMNPRKPLNPMINAGAIAVTSLINGQTVNDKLGRLLQFVHELSGNTKISVNEKVARSEHETAHLNRALAHFMKEDGVLTGSIEDILALYFQQCGIEVTCLDLARIGAVLANEGKDIASGRQMMPVHVARICKTFMVTCGMYNASGEFAIHVGIPAKSGVSGGILGAVPFQLGIGVFGPSLDEKGNSVGGVSLLESISKRWDFSIF